MQQKYLSLTLAILVSFAASACSMSNEGPLDDVPNHLRQHVQLLNQYHIYMYVMGANIAIAKLKNDHHFPRIQQLLDEWHQFGGSGTIEDFYVELCVFLSLKLCIKPFKTLCCWLKNKEGLKDINSEKYQAIIQQDSIKERREKLKPALMAYYYQMKQELSINTIHKGYNNEESFFNTWFSGICDCYTSDGRAWFLDRQDDC